MRHLRTQVIGRRNGTSASGSPATGADQAPASSGGRVQAVPKRRWKLSFPPALRSIRSYAIGALAAAAVILAFRLANPPPKPLSREDVAKTVEKSLKELRKEPPIAARAYAAVRDSLVLVRALPPGAKKTDRGSLGTGIVVEDTGAILTNLHVVAGGEKIFVVFADGFESEAAVVGVQKDNDLAVLQPAVVPDDLVPATLAGSGHLRPGDEVVAVGNPFGIVGSVSAGVVSGVGRVFVSPRTGESMTGLIQFDAAVNPGNSGGPLLDRNGEVVGIVTALLNPTEQEVFIGIGFAVTIENAAGALGIPPW